MGASVWRTDVTDAVPTVWRLDVFHLHYWDCLVGKCLSFSSTKFHSPHGNLWFVSAALLSESLPRNNSFWTVWKKRKTASESVEYDDLGPSGDGLMGKFIWLHQISESLVQHCRTVGEERRQEQRDANFRRGECVLSWIQVLCPLTEWSYAPVALSI